MRIESRTFYARLRHTPTIAEQRERLIGADHPFRRVRTDPSFTVWPCRPLALTNRASVNALAPRSQMEFCPDPVQSLVARPQPCAVTERRGSKQVNVDVTDTPAMQPMALDKAENLLVVGGDGLRQLPEQSQDRGPIRQAATGDLTDNKRMRGHLPAFERGGEPGITPPQMVDPDRGVDKDQTAARRRRIAFSRV